MWVADNNEQRLGTSDSHVKPLGLLRKPTLWRTSTPTNNSLERTCEPTTARNGQLATNQSPERTVSNQSKPGTDS